MKASAAAVHNFQLGFIALRGFFAADGRFRKHQICNSLIR
jgi:hypothetical protein